MGFPHRGPRDVANKMSIAFIIIGIWAVLALAWEAAKWLMNMIPKLF